MNSLLKKKKILYDTMSSKVTDKRYVIAFQDYVGFLAEQGTDLLIHLAEEVVERKRKLEKLTEQQDDLV
jgi:hypothetical protein